MFSFPPQVLGVAKVLALETGPRLTPADVSNREPFAHKMHVGRGYKLKVQIHAPTSGGTL